MDKIEFLEKLKEALENNGEPQIVRENVKYYSQYIADEIRKGRSEQEVLDELGDPWLIAKTIAESAGVSSCNEYACNGSERKGYPNTKNVQKNMKSFIIDTWWKKLLLVLGIIGIAFGIISLIMGIISLFAPIMVPLILGFVLVKMIKEKDR